MKFRALVVALVILATVHCSTSPLPVTTPTPTPTPTPRCPALQDSVDIRSPVVLISGSAARQLTCQTVAAGTEIQEESGGVSTGTFKTDATCNFYQLPPVAVGSSPKTVTVVTRDTSSSIFRLTDGELDCTLHSGTAIGPLCGQVTVNTIGTYSGVYASCNADPVATVAVYRGNVRVTITSGSSQRVFPLNPGQSLAADFITGQVTPGAAQFTKEQIALFDAQYDAILSGQALSDGISLLSSRSLTPSDNVVAPNALETYVGKQNYGQVKAMCAAVPTPMIFYPATPLAPTPVLYGALCTGRSARVYGLAIYRPDKQLVYGGQFYSESGGTLVATAKFANPAQFELQGSQNLFTWTGQLGPLSPAQIGSTVKTAQASKAVYVVKFVYDLPPDTTPRIGLAAISYGGAFYPPIIG